jgi:DeoR/GlpR family transcriptional regulator of sugar metabolism
MAKVIQGDLVTVHIAADLLKVSPDTIRRWHKK